MTIAAAVGKLGAAYLNDKHGADKVAAKDAQWVQLNDEQIEKALNGIFGDPAEGGATVASETATTEQALEDLDQAFCDMLDKLMQDDVDPTDY